MPASTFVAMFTIMMIVTGSMWRLVYVIKDLVFMVGILHESLKILDPAPAKDTPSQPMSSDGSKPPHIMFDKVGFGYKDSDDLILDDFSLSIQHGERVILVGKIGAGKSTLLKLLMKYYQPSKGQIYINGVQYANIPPSEIRRRIGYVPQVPILFDRTVYENINYGRIRYCK
jgi:ABC-type bacteriocin/lantibiotic exporter with double-glycine peptidase domain